jgi:hypothetical protein
VRRLYRAADVLSIIYINRVEIGCSGRQLLFLERISTKVYIYEE